MALIHDVIDSDVRFTIDPVTRTISNQGSKKLVLTRGDHNSERFTFEIPRYVEGHDMSLCNVVRIHFINTDSRTREEMADIYEPDDASLLPTDDQIFTFSWLIERKATTFAGPLAFAIEFQCVVEGTVVYSWRTAANSTITIVNGINNAISTDVEVDEPPIDIYSTIRVATVASMIHDVIDSDVRFVIDPVTRTISNQGSKKLILIQGDHKSERFTFEIPRLVEGHDMSLCNAVRIHYINTNSKTRSIVTDIYEPTDMGVHPTLTDIVTFSWLIARSATTFAGTLAFSVEFQCVVDDIVEYSWHTGVNNTIAISDGISNTEVLNEEYSDILTIWWERLYATSELPIEIITTKMLEDLGYSTQDNTLYILEDDPTLDEIEAVIEKTKEFDTQLTEHLEQYEALDKSMTEHLEKYTELDKNISDHFEDFESLLSKVTLLEERLHKLETGSGDGTCVHEWVETVVNPTCTERGYTLYECSKCDHSYIDSYTDATGHVWSYVQQGPDLWDRKCSVCGEEENDVEFPCINNTEHSWTEIDPTAATCTEASIRRYHCDVCDATKNGEIIQEALGHSMIFDTSVNPTCTKEGSITFRCSRCITYIETEPVAVIAHTYVDGVCSVCGATEHDSGSYSIKIGETFTIEYPSELSITVDHPECVSSYVDSGSVLFTGVSAGTGTIYIRVSDTLIGQYSVTVMAKEVEVPSDSKSVKVDETFTIPYSTLMSGIVIIYPEEYLSASIGTDQTIFTALKVGSCTITVADRGTDICYYNVTISEKASGGGSGEATCDHVLGDPNYDALGAYEPTCATPGYAYFTCEVCKETVWDTVPATGKHSWSDAIYNAVGYYKPTCTEPGFAAYVCDKCGGEKEATVPALQHDYKETYTNATCDSQGYTTRTCTRCDYSYTYNYTSALGHSWGDPYYSDVFSSGYGRKCENCDELDELTAPDEGGEETCDHDYTSSVTTPTCTVGGHTRYTCTKCGDSYTDDYKPATGHSWSEWDTVTAVTCTTDGLRTRICEECGKTEDETISATGHSYTSKVTEATCTTGGYTTYTCSTCGHSYTDSETEPNGHDYRTGWVTITPATCTSSGTEERNCLTCGNTETRTIPATGIHSYTSEVTEATCTTGGYTTHTCSKCGHSYTDSETEPNGHDYRTGWVTITPATCTSSGTEERNCLTCGNTETRDIPALGHDYKAEPDSSQSSGYIGVCDRCGDIIEDYTP